MWLPPFDVIFNSPCKCRCCQHEWKYGESTSPPLTDLKDIEIYDSYILCPKCGGGDKTVDWHKLKAGE